MANNLIDKQLYENIMQQLSYTNRDYQSILGEILNLFTGETPITDNWDNMSSSDPFFIILHLLAAHKDILNYQIDYQVLEGYMSTARERASKVRIANSFGFKIPSYKASYSEFLLDTTDLPLYRLSAYDTTLLDTRGVPWTYIGETITEETPITTGLPFVQGTSLRLEFPVGSLHPTTRTQVIGNQKIAIGNNRDTKGVSRLTLGNLSANGIVFTEVESLTTYDGDNKYVYELNVDPYRITYLRLPQTIDLTDFSGQRFVLDYIITEGSKPIGTGNILGYLNEDPTRVELTPVAGTFVAGSNPMEDSEINQAFNDYYAGVDTLVTLRDYKRYIEKQKEILGIDKVLVLDRDNNTGDFINTSQSIQTKVAKGEVVIYATKGGEPLNQVETLFLKELLDKRRMTSLFLSINKTSLSTVPQNTELKSAPIKIKLNLLPPTLAARNGVKAILRKYVENKGIGSQLTTSEIYSLLLTSEYAVYYHNGISVQIAKNSGAFNTQAVSLNFFEFAKITDNDITT